MPTAVGGKRRVAQAGQVVGQLNGRRRRRAFLAKSHGGFTRTASGTTATLLVEMDVSGASPRATTPVYTDITLQAMQISNVHRGRAYELAEIDTGAASILLDDHDRLFDPLNTAGTYYPNVKPMRKTRVSVQMLGQTFRAFTGYALRFPPVWERPSWASVNVALVDGFGPLGFEDNLVAVFAQEDTGTRIGHVLDAIGFPAGDRLIDTGVSQCAAVTFTADQNQAAIDHIRAAERTENGLFYFDGSGRAVFKNRQTVTRQSTPKAIFSDVGDLDFDDATGDYSDRLIYNEVTVTDNAGNSVTVVDATSQDAYWPRSLARDTLLPAGGTETTSAAQWLLLLYKQPGFRFERLTFTASLHDKLMYEALTREIGDMIQVTFTPPGGGAQISQNCIVQSIAHQVEPADDLLWVTSYELAPAPAVGLWMLDTSLLDSGTMLSY